MSSDIILNEDNVTLEGHRIYCHAADFILDDVGRRSGTDTNDPNVVRRALVHDPGDGLTVNWDHDYPGGITVNGNVLMNDELSVGGNVRMAGELSVDGNVHMPANLSVDGDANVARNLSAHRLSTNATTTNVLKVKRTIEIEVPDPALGLVEQVGSAETSEGSIVLLAPGIFDRPGFSGPRSHPGLDRPVNGNVRFNTATVDLGGEIMSLRSQIADLREQINALTKP